MPESPTSPTPTQLVEAEEPTRKSPRLSVQAQSRMAVSPQTKEPAGKSTSKPASSPSTADPSQPRTADAETSEETKEQLFRNPATWVAIVFNREVLAKRLKKNIWKRALYIAGTRPDEDMVTHLEKTNGVKVPLTDFDCLGDYSVDNVTAINAFRKELQLGMQGKSRSNDRSKGRKSTETVKKRNFGTNSPAYDPNIGVGPFLSPLPSDIRDSYANFQTKVLNHHGPAGQTTDGSDSDCSGVGSDSDCSDVGFDSNEHGTIGLHVGDQLEIVSHVPHIAHGKFQIIDFERDGIRVGCLRSEKLNRTHVDNPGTDLVRVRDRGKKRKVITNWNKIEVKRWPAMSQHLFDKALQRHRKRSEAHVPVPEEIQGFLPKFTNNEDLIHGSKVYGDMNQKAHDESFTNIGQLAYPPVYKLVLGDTFTDPGECCRCFICGVQFQEKNTSKMSTSLGLDLTQAYEAGTVKNINAYHKLKLIDHVKVAHPDTPFHYLVPWTYTLISNKQIYSSAIRLQEMLWRGFESCSLPLGLFFHTSQSGNDSALKSQLSRIIGFAMCKNSESQTLNKKALMEKWQPDCVDTVNVNPEMRRETIKYTVGMAVREAAVGLVSLGDSLACFDFVQFLDLHSKSKSLGHGTAEKHAWNSVCLLFSRGMLMTGPDRLPFVNPDAFLMPLCKDMVETANERYNLLLTKAAASEVGEVAKAEATAPQMEAIAVKSEAAAPMNVDPVAKTANI